jgi:hypothetical protein
MNVLDENVSEGQYEILRSRRVSIRQIGLDLGRNGMQDEEVIPLLHRLGQPTFFTLDMDYYKRHWCHEGYCLVYLDIRENLVADYVRRVLRHRELNTKAKRCGLVLRALPTGLTFWRVHQADEGHLAWQ